MNPVYYRHNTYNTPVNTSPVRVNTKFGALYRTLKPGDSLQLRNNQTGEDTNIVLIQLRGSNTANFRAYLRPANNQEFHLDCRSVSAAVLTDTQLLVQPRNNDIGEGRISFTIKAPEHVTITHIEAPRVSRSEFRPTLPPVRANSGSRHKDERRANWERKKSKRH